MNTISHEQAQGLLQNRLDGLFDETQEAALDQHLKDCVVCQGFAARLEQVDATLRQGYRAHAQALNIAMKQNPLPDSAIATLQDKMRLKMKSKQVLNFTNSIAFGAVMLVLTIGFSWLISSQGKVKLPDLNGGPASALIAPATPISWTKETPLRNPEQVVAILNGLADKNVSAFQQMDWVHTIRRDPGQPGTAPTTDSEAWFQYPRASQTCIAGMEVVAQELGSTPLHILVSRAGGISGDLIQLRSGSGTITYLKPGDYGCSLRPEFTRAGQLAAQVKKKMAVSVEKMDIQAWYETADDHTVFAVAVTFTATPEEKASGIGITQQTYDFEVENGLLTHATTRTKREDGQWFGESTQVFVTEFIATLPVEVAAQWKEFSGELQAFAVRP
jgi:hypothetical protein